MPHTEQLDDVAKALVEAITAVAAYTVPSPAVPAFLQHLASLAESYPEGSPQRQVLVLIHSRMGPLMEE
ncbi:hypothetical protein LVB87_12490 [Lysobacter sp. KIS68-7]|uniref:hypothetical protein n=1 Tax=Lysobacter sp. KIS68-7 TaxID=2904252 RepID=UPI001E5514E4|nr:hypothetical protein [Lysobacter sp. KIS68-7]UHQ18994.1 hypothetical protein LVB87_12490 [Lysobacter sp. KIS68-7]